MNSQDIPAGMELVRAAGWNQTEADWGRFLSAGAAGCFVAESRGLVCGTAAAICYGTELAWIGMVLVSRSQRSKGIGTSLLTAALKHLDSQALPTVKLDATPQGKPLYERLGFEPECEIERWRLNLTPHVEQKCGAPELDRRELEKVFELDREVFGADRSRLLRSLHHDAPEFTVTVLHNGTLAGYVFGRHGLNADHLGPWVARDGDSASELLKEFLNRARRQHLIVDLVKSNSSAGEMLRAAGFDFSRPLTRMVRGTNVRPANARFACAILGPEFG